MLDKEQNYHSLVFSEQTMTFEERIQIAETGLFIVVPRTSLMSFNSIMFMCPQLSNLARQSMFVNDDGQVAIRNNQAMRELRATVKVFNSLLKSFHRYTLEGKDGIIAETNEPLPEFLDYLEEQEKSLKVDGVYPTYQRICAEATKIKFHNAMCTLYDVSFENHKKRKEALLKALESVKKKK